LHTIPAATRNCSLINSSFFFSFFHERLIPPPPLLPGFLKKEISPFPPPPPHFRECAPQYQTSPFFLFPKSSKTARLPRVCGEAGHSPGLFLCPLLPALRKYFAETLKCFPLSLPPLSMALDSIAPPFPEQESDRFFSISSYTWMAHPDDPSCSPPFPFPLQALRRLSFSSFSLIYQM